MKRSFAAFLLVIFLVGAVIGYMYTDSKRNLTLQAPTGAVVLPVASDTISIANFNIQVYGVSKADKPDVMPVLGDTIRNFEKETGIKVRYDLFDSNEILHAKLVAGKSGYDIVVPSSNWARTQIEGGLLRPLDKAKLPNLANLDPGLQGQIARLDNVQGDVDALVEAAWARSPSSMPRATLRRLPAR